MRFTRRIIVLSLVVIALFVGANAIVQKVAENRIASAIKKSFHTSSAPSVSLQGFPIIFDVLRGVIPRAMIRATGVRVVDLSISSLTIDLDGVHAKLSDLAAGKAVFVDRGLATASVSDNEITAYVQSRGHHVSIRVDPGDVLVTGSIPGGRQATARGVPRLIGRLLVFHPDRVSIGGQPLAGPAESEAKQWLSFEVDVPELPGGIRITDLELASGTVRLTAKLEKSSFGMT